MHRWSSSFLFLCLLILMISSQGRKGRYEIHWPQQETSLLKTARTASCSASSFVFALMDSMDFKDGRLCGLEHSGIFPLNMLCMAQLRESEKIADVDYDMVLDSTIFLTHFGGGGGGTHSPLLEYYDVSRLLKA